jgi:threonylcarbamoyladenosine tRNA methylthiotransferase MtaB
MWLRRLVGTEQDVLVERPGDRGHAGNFADVRVPVADVGSIQRVSIAGLDGSTLLASPVTTGAQLGDASGRTPRFVTATSATGPRPSPGKVQKDVLA